MSRDRGPSSSRGGRSGRPDYKVYRARRRPLQRRPDPEFAGLGTLRHHARRRRLGSGAPVSPGRVVRLAILAALVWIAVSLVVFLVSAQIEEARSPTASDRALDPGPVMPVSANSILVLGSDARPPGTGEDGANVVGQPSRADTIMLLRAGGLRSARLSIPRDTIVNIPGYGPGRINAAYAIGGPALTISTVEEFLGIDVNHVVEVNFDNFPRFIDALGGINVRTGCVRGELDGGGDNGGVSLDLEPGPNHLSGKQALALARLRKNRCDSTQDDRDRAARQQQILRSIKNRLVSPAAFVRLPLVSWAAPKAIRTDMAGPTLLALFAGVQLGGNPPTRVLDTTPNGDGSLSVPEEARRSAVRRFLEG